jgi:hypothetical protein
MDGNREMARWVIFGTDAEMAQNPMPRPCNLAQTLKCYNNCQEYKLRVAFLNLSYYSTIQLFPETATSNCKSPETPTNSILAQSTFHPMQGQQYVV